MTALKDRERKTRDAYCPSCKKDTAQDGYEKGPGDHDYEQWECRDCLWTYSGYSGRWNPPLILGG